MHPDQHSHWFIHFWEHLILGFPDDVWWHHQRNRWPEPSPAEPSAGASAVPPTFGDGASPRRLGEAVALPHGAAEADVHEALRGRRERGAAAQQEADLPAQQHPHLAEDKAETQREKHILGLQNKTRAPIFGSELKVSTVFKYALMTSKENPEGAH